MVLTGAVLMSVTGHSRRRVLAGAAGLSVASLAGCGFFDDDPELPEAPDALQPLLDEALALAAAYDRAVVTEPGLATRLTPLADDHRAHAAELARLIGATLPSTSGSSAASAGAVSASAAAGAETVATLRAAEQAAQKTAVAACKAAPAERAALVGSIAASRATHAEALR
ncbi:hypothetical protein [Actinoplanes solisilvae]|uniref:hypothetical protein n=1 Tax=Actinoplanes solisilvae TaxID=2486853 RepID=UPI00196A5B46|nr:hypothetical protein [Actinoplanes solisilvae]